MTDIHIQPAEHAEPDEVTSVRTVGLQLAAEAREARSGRSGRTIISEPGLHATMIALNAGSGLAEHKAPSAATLLCLSGDVTLAAGGREWKLHEHDTVAIPEELHSLFADTDAVVLLTIRLA